MKYILLYTMLAIIMQTYSASAQPFRYPQTKRGEVVDDYHGTLVADPYRWLESLDNDDVKAWIKAQNDLSRPYLENLPAREAFKERLTELWDYPRYGAPFQKGGRYFFFHNNGLQNQDVLYVNETLEGEPRELLNLNNLTKDATTSLGGFSVSHEGRYLAYGLSDAGTDWRIWHVREVPTGKDLPDVILGSKFSVPVAWSGDEGGFYYARYPQREDGSYDDSRQASVYYHRLGEPQETDRLVYRVVKERLPIPIVTDDGRYLLIVLSAGSDANELYLKRLDREDAPFTALVKTADALYWPIGNHNDTLYIQTTKDALSGRVIAVEAGNPGEAHWQELVPEIDSALQEASYVGGHFIVQYLQDARARVRIHDRRGRYLRDVQLPGIGSVEGFKGEADNNITFFSFTSFTTPGAIYRYDVEANKPELWKRSEPKGFDPEDYLTEQVFYTSKDSTRVPMFIIHKRGMERNGNNPTLLYGYGGFSVSETPDYSPAKIAWLERGGIFAVANLRGGGEYGEAWHEAGTKLKKQNVFDDFIAAAEYLIEHDYTRPERLAVQGRSNGGLLVGAVITQRPELFGAALPAVGVLDMLRYQTASANARQWSADYGLSENPEEFKALYAYSPYHNVKQGTCYPPTLITTADHDDRVVPWHSYKFAAALQYAQGCDNPILLRVETRAGHGAGTPTWMRIEQVADRLAFLERFLKP